MVKLVSAAEAAKIIPDGAVVTVSSSSGLCCPDAVLEGDRRALRCRTASAQASP